MKSLVQLQPQQPHVRASHWEFISGLDKYIAQLSHCTTFNAHFQRTRPGCRRDRSVTLAPATATAPVNLVRHFLVSASPSKVDGV